MAQAGCQEGARGRFSLSFGWGWTGRECSRKNWATSSFRIRLFAISVVEESFFGSALRLRYGRLQQAEICDLLRSAFPFFDLLLDVMVVDLDGFANADELKPLHYRSLRKASPYLS